MYEKIIEFIPYLENKNTVWSNEQDNILYYNYSKIACNLMSAIEEKMLGSSNTYNILKKYNISMDDIYSLKFDYETCTPELAFAILAVILRSERFCTGSFAGAIEKGIVLKLIKVLAKENESK